MSENVKRPYPLHVGSIISFWPGLMCVIPGELTERAIIDRVPTGYDADGKTTFKYRIDVGNSLVELWFPDAMLVGMLKEVRR